MYGTPEAPGGGARLQVASAVVVADGPSATMHELPPALIVTLPVGAALPDVACTEAVTAIVWP